MCLRVGVCVCGKLQREQSKIWKVKAAAAEGIAKIGRITAMAKVISQDTFDDVVKENVVEFSMTPSEAKEETIKQFEAQVSNVDIVIQ